jgi:hypothetical protein
MMRGSTDNISIIIVGLNDPTLKREPKKGNEHIKIMSNITNTVTKKITFQKKSEKSTAESMKLTKQPAKFSSNPGDPEFKLINSNDSHFLFLTL